MSASIVAPIPLRSLTLEERKALSAWETAERLNEILAAMDVVREARKTYMRRLRDARKGKLRCSRSDHDARIAFEEMILDAKEALDELQIDAQSLAKELTATQTLLRAIPA